MADGSSSRLPATPVMMPGLGGALATVGRETSGARTRRPTSEWVAQSPSNYGPVSRSKSAPMPTNEGWLEKLRPEGTGFSALKTKKWQKRYFKLSEGVLRWAHNPETIDD